MTATFAGRNALIYGGGNGIGRAVALEFARRGAQVAIADIDETAASETANLVRAEGSRAVACACDVTDTDNVRRAGDTAEAELGPIDIVVNNVGAIVMGHPEDLPLDEWQRLIDINLMGAVRGIDHFLPRMIARGSGHIVNTASFAGLYPYASTRLPYVTAKAGLVALSESLALHCLPRGVRVSCFCPGPVLTGIAGKMRTFTPDAEFRGPGSELAMKTAAEAATTLAEGMEAGRIVIPTDEQAWAAVRDHGADPDGFIHGKIAQFAAGDLGRPVIPDTLKAQIAGLKRD